MVSGTMFRAPEKLMVICGLENFDGSIVSNRKITRQKPYDTFLSRVAEEQSKVATNNKRKTQNRASTSASDG